MRRAASLCQALLCACDAGFDTRAARQSASFIRTR